MLVSTSFVYVKKVLKKLYILRVFQGVSFSNSSHGGSLDDDISHAGSFTTLDIILFLLLSLFSKTSIWHSFTTIHIT